MPPQPPRSPSPQTAAQNAPPANAAPANVPPAAAPHYFAVVDASHGGDDHGESLSSSLLEKDVTLALARSLRQELQSRGIITVVLRDTEANLPVDQRAVFANADHAAIYIALHAASSGRGVRVFTAMLPFGSDDHGPFRSWSTAQHDLAFGQSEHSQRRRRRIAETAVAGEELWQRRCVL